MTSEDLLIILVLIFAILLLCVIGILTETRRLRREVRSFTNHTELHLTSIQMDLQLMQLYNQAPRTPTSEDIPWSALGAPRDDVVRPSYTEQLHDVQAAEGGQLDKEL